MCILKINRICGGGEWEASQLLGKREIFLGCGADADADALPTQWHGVKMSSDLDFFMFPKRVYVAGIPKTKPTNKVENKCSKERGWK